MCSTCGAIVKDILVEGLHTLSFIICIYLHNLHSCRRWTKQKNNQWSSRCSFTNVLQSEKVAGIYCIGCVSNCLTAVTLCLVLPTLVWFTTVKGRNNTVQHSTMWRLLSRLCYLCAKIIINTSFVVIVFLKKTMYLMYIYLNSKHIAQSV